MTRFEDQKSLCVTKPTALKKAFVFVLSYYVGSSVGHEPSISSWFVFEKPHIDMILCRKGGWVKVSCMLGEIWSKARADFQSASEIVSIDTVAIPGRWLPIIEHLRYGDLSAPFLIHSKHRRTSGISLKAESRSV